MTDISIENQILKAMDIVVNSGISQLELDKTILAVVEQSPPKEDRFTGEHTVRYQDSSFKAYSTNPNLYYEPGTVVYVQIPKSDFSEKKIITGGKNTVPGDILASNLFFGDTTTINGGNIQTGTIDAGAITLGARNATLTGKFMENYSNATTINNGHLWYEGGTVTVPGNLGWTDQIGPFIVAPGDKCTSPAINSTYWVYIKIPGTTSNNIFTPNTAWPAVIEIALSVPADTYGYKNIKLGIWQTGANKKGVLALSLGQTYINGGEIITGTIIADYMRVGGGATQIGVDEFYNESKSLILTASSPIYSFDSSDTLTPSNQSITFTANLYHLDIQKLAFSIQAYDSGGTLISSATPLLNINGNQAILSASELSSDYFSIKVTATAEGYSDFVTVNKVKNGTDGASGTRTAIIELYKWSESEPIADFPSGQVVYTWETGQISALPSTDNGWALTPPSSVPEGQILWGCRTIYTDQDNSPSSTVNFSAEDAYPIGGAGSSGKDGKGYEFIYYLSNSPEAPTPAPSAASDPGWSAKPSSVTKNTRYLYASFRTSNEGIWGDYSNPVLWAKYGTDGTGVSYIYTRTTTKTPAPGTPAGDGGTIPDDWTDEPAGVDATNKYEWISVSHYTDEKWQLYSPPSLYNEFTASSLLITLTNENHSFTCDSEGTPISGSYADGATTINVLYGTEYLTFQAGSEDPTEEKRFIISYNAAGVSLTPSAESINSSTFTPQTMTANSATVTFTIRALINGEIISGTKVMSYSKQIPGASSYFHIAYSNSANGNPMNQTGGTYVGTYVDDNPLDSTNYLDYTWRLWKGADGVDGTDGIRGEDGANGESSYLHLKYSNDGGQSFTTSLGETPGAWLGQYVDNILQDSTDPGRYTWKKIEGEVGAQGPQGEQGIPGSKGDKGDKGDTGPGILFRGAYSSSKPYYADANRRDVVSYNNNYYIRKSYGSGSLGKLPSNTAYWELMTSFASVATDFLLAQDAQITKVLNIGTNSMNSFANITLNGDTNYPYFSLGQTPFQEYDESGIFIGKENDSYKLSLVSSDSTKKLLWDGSNLSIIGGTITGGVLQTALPGANRVVISGKDADQTFGFGYIDFHTAHDALSHISVARPARIGAYIDTLEPGSSFGSLYISSPQYDGSPVSSIGLYTSRNDDSSMNSCEAIIQAKSVNLSLTGASSLNSVLAAYDSNGNTTLSLSAFDGGSGLWGGVRLKGLQSAPMLHVRTVDDQGYADVRARTLYGITSLRTDDLLQMKEKGGTNSLRDLYLWTDGTTWQLRFYVGAALKKLTFTN